MRPVALALLCLAAASAPEAQIAVSAYADKTVLSEGETLLFTVEITGTDDVGSPAPPRAGPGLRLLSPVPSVRQRTTFGAQTRLRLGWRYQAVATGPTQLGTMRVRVAGQSFSTDPIPISVTAPQSPPPAASGGRGGGQGSGGAASGGQASGGSALGSGGLVIRAEPRTREAVVGQQVVVDYVLYFDPARVSPRQALAVGTWDAQGFWREELDVPTAATYPRAATLGGRTLQAVTIRRLALFPARPGRLELAPMRYDIETREPEGFDPFAGLFSPFRSRRVDRRVTAPATSIEVNPLPPGAPPSFSGAVGTFTLAGRVAPTSASPGEAVQLALTLRGTGNAAALAAPEIEAPPGVDAYDPESDRTEETSRAPLVSTRTFGYTFVPQRGSFEIPAVEWSYYDPEAGAYKTLREGPWPVSVSGAPLAEAAPEAGPSRWQRAPGLPTAPLWGVLGVGLVLPAVAALGVLGVRRRRQRPRPAPAPDPAARLRRASDRPPREQAAETERAVREALAARLGPDARALPRRALAARVAESAGPEASGAVDAVLARCARARYAGEADDALAADAEAALARLDA